MTALYNYTAENAVKMAGTLTMVKIGTGDSATYVSIQGIQSMVDVGNTATTIDQTTVEDTSKRYIAGIKDGADQTIEFVNYSSDANQTALKNAADLGQIVTFKHQWPSGDIAEYEATLLGWKMLAGGVEDLQKFSVDMKLNGDITWSTAS